LIKIIGGKMKDLKFKVAIAVIIVLVLALLYLVVIGPSIQGYVINQQIQGQQATINAIIQTVDQQGYVVLGNGENAIVLSRNPQLEQQLQEAN
jgi:uncharacterized membrane protein affecting hemolysin expression